MHVQCTMYCMYVAVIQSKRTRSLMMPRSTPASRSLHSLPPHLSPSPSSPAYSPPSPHTLSISSSYTRRYTLTCNMTEYVF